MTHTIHGLVPILATPFHVDGSLDMASLRRLTEFNISGHADGLAVSGMASEAFALTAKERQTILTEVVRIADGALPVVAGVNGTSTVTAIEQAREAEAGGATCLMVLPPFMVKPSAAQLVDFYQGVAEAVDLEIMVQDAPGPTGVQMAVATVVELSEIRGITSLKVEAPPTAQKVGAVVAAVQSGQFAVLGGNNAQLCLEEYARGAIGTMPACEFTDALSVILDKWNSGNQDDARQEFAALLPLLLFGVQPGLAWAVHKEVLVRRGIIDHATVRLPAGALDGVTRAALMQVLESLQTPLRHIKGASAVLG
ncbi:dihydrodipicolinate synthase family protein [Cryobacterium sp. Y50]|uniref:dihydrodipicolinate synthase family protein n=1 Tax=Cryobacterium sp. Y50 TaxID=2048286 RepID=UPI000CE47ED8|nr:dihydrodipicolinate synthase family protein [Cryobacterium sp. Y50]